MLWSGVGGLLALLAFFLHNWKRAQLREVQELKLNCLLTSSPLVFIPGKRSVFYFMAYWNEIPHWLASHGYDVFTLPLPWKNPKRRLEALETFFRRQSEAKEKIHLFIDSSSLDEITSLLEKADPSCLSSVTLVGKNLEKNLNLSPRCSIAIEETELPEESSSASPLFWLLHRIWTLQFQKVSLSQLGWKLSRLQGDFLLERVQFLAERDLLRKQASPNLKS